MFKKALVVVELVSVLVAHNDYGIKSIEVNSIPFKVEEAMISVPKSNSALSKPNTVYDETTIYNLNTFLDERIETLYRNKLSSLYGGKTYLTSLNSVWDIANYLVGRPGECYYIAQLFIDMYLGPEHRIVNAKLVEEPLPGDVIYYRNGGLGVEHWAIYLGNDAALQGNYLGTTIIGGVYLQNASKPIFYRVP